MEPASDPHRLTLADLLAEACAAYQRLRRIEAAIAEGRGAGGPSGLHAERARALSRFRAARLAAAAA